MCLNVEWHELCEVCALCIGYSLIAAVAAVADAVAAMFIHRVEN